MLREHAPAKINLNLHIVGKRADGYHLLESMVVFTELGDWLEVREAHTLSLEIEGPFAASLPADNNSILKAANALRNAANIHKGAAITLCKNLPVASGIGGGSADAAATLRALSRLWNIYLDAQTMQRIALSLGADVPVCLASTPSVMRGVGEIIESLPAAKSLAMLLVNPGVPVHTHEIFTRFNQGYTTPQQALGWDDIQTGVNDLQYAAIELQPVIQHVLDAIQSQSGCRLARMSGSGATCFGLFEDDAQVTQAAENIVRIQPQWWVQATRSLV